jgi:hypothetical protein
VLSPEQFKQLKTGQPIFEAAAADCKKTPFVFEHVQATEGRHQRASPWIAGKSLMASTSSTPIPTTNLYVCRTRLCTENSRAPQSILDEYVREVRQQNANL